MHEIFISYRQDDSAGWALILRDALVARFGAERVYLDKDSQRAGNWKEQIREGLARSRVVLVPIGPRWLDARTPGGQRRLDMPDDVHRWEIAQALSTLGVTVIPVLVERAAMPAAAALTADIRPLADTQWRELAYDAARREVDMARLVADIEGAAGIVASKPKTARSGWLERLALLIAAFVFTLLALTAGEMILGWPPLAFGAKVMVFLLLLGLVLLGRRLQRRFSRGR